MARLKKRDFKKPDKVPRNYDQQPFHVDGKIVIDIEFRERTMTTPVYVKMDAPEELLLSEGVCRQLGIINYHPEVKPFRTVKTSSTAETQNDDRCTVPKVRIITNEDVRLLPNQCVMTQVRLDGEIGASN